MRNIILTFTVIIILISLSSFTGYYVLSRERIETANVTKVLDGDTIELESGERVRLLGINAPEINEAYYQKAKNRLTELVEGKTIKMERGLENKDKYGRLLRYVFVDDIFVNLQMIKEGYAIFYMLNPEDKYFDELKNAEKEAKDNQLGLWNSLVKNKCIEILIFNFNAAGDDNKNLNDEYVTFQNICDYSINMDKWTVKDETNNIYTFKDFIFKPNSTLTLYTGAGNDTTNELYWNKKRAVWNNDGDTLFLRDDKGNLILSYSYP